jgi:signal-transduction protein with cAMP-binding, CBS, and nucleotidyltransferase domain
MMSDQPAQRELRSILQSTRVGDLKLAPCPILQPTATVAEAADAMRRHSHGSAMVCTAGKVVGIFTERDLMRVVAAGKGLQLPLSQVMTANPKTVTMAETLFEVARSMDEGGYRRLPVVDATGNPTSIIDVKALVHFLVEHFPATIYNQASHAQVTAKKCEGA